MAFAMRITGTAADWCEHEGAKVGQTGPEFVRSIIRLGLQARGIDYRSRPPRPPVPAALRPPPPEPLDAGDVDAPEYGELPGQTRLPLDVPAGDAIEKFKAGQKQDQDQEEVDPFGE